MRATLALALVACLAVSVAAQSSTGPAGPTPNSPCDRILQGLNYSWTDPAQAYLGIQMFVGKIALGNTGPSGPVVGLFADPATMNFFNGQIKYREGSISPFAGTPTANYTDSSADNQAQLKTLVMHLGQFLGGALACSQSGASAAFPAYSYTYMGNTFTQYQVHQNMNVSNAAFTQFNNIAVNTAANFGATSADQTAFKNALAMFARDNVASHAHNMDNQICWSAALSCPCNTGITGANCDNAGPTPQPAGAASVQVSVVSMLLAALLALVSMRR